MGDLNEEGKELIYAVEENNLEKVQQMIDQNGLSYSPSWLEGYVFLCKATQAKRTEVVKLLLKNGSKVNNDSSKPAMTPLHFAAENGDVEVVEMLLDKGAHVNAGTEDGLTPLHVAIENDRETAVRIYLEHGVDVNAKSVDNQTPLNLAVEKSSLTIIREILRYKPDPNDEHNRLALCSAVRKCGRDSEKIVADLLDYGLAISPRDIIDGSLLYAAVKNGYEKIVEDLLKYGADANYSGTETSRKSSLLHIAAEKGRDSIIKLLINYGADVNSKDSNGRTPIYYAVENKKLEATKQLLDNNAHIENSSDLLRLAIESRTKKVLEILLRYNINVNAVDKNGATALHIAVKRNHTKMVKLLLDYSADVNSVSRGHKTPLHSAASNENKSITTMLLDKGANVNAAKANGVTALHIACSKGYSEVVKILLKYGAECNCVENKGATPLHVATAKNRKAVVEILLRYDADIELKNDNGVTAFRIAFRKGFDKIFHILLEHGSDINCVTEDKPNLFDYVIPGEMSSASRYDIGDIDLCDIGLPGGPTNTYGILLECFQLHMIKLRAANLYSSDNNIYLGDKYEISYFHTDCEKEIENMESEKISDNISFYDILTKGISQLVAYARNENVRQALTTNDYKTKFPIYASMINIQVEKGIKRNDLLEQSCRFFGILCDSFPMLPHLCVDKILTHLSNHDLKNLINASKATNISYLTK